MRIRIFAATVFALAASQSGCSHLPERPSWTRWNAQTHSLGLPSPEATIAGSSGRTSAKSARKQAPPSDAVTSAVARGESLEAAGKSDKAGKVYAEAFRQNPESPEAAHALGVWLDKQGRHTDAEQCFLLALQKQPRNPELLSDLGYCYLLEGRLDNAEAALVKATTLDPKNSRYRNNLGLVIGHQRRYDDAFAEFAKAGSEADAYYNMAYVFAAQDLPDEAKGCFQEALAVNPNYLPAKEALASFEEFDRLTPDQQQAAPALAKGGVRYVPYIEGGANSNGSGEVQQASAITPVNTMPANRHAGRATRNLQAQSRGLLGGHMQSERNAQSEANAASVQGAR
jgi:tetratricopeptide (TPR) repeat protein